jgi:hypothetical protein
MRRRMTGPSRRMTGNVAPRGVGQGTTGFARGAPFGLLRWRRNLTLGNGLFQIGMP